MERYVYFLSLAQQRHSFSPLNFLLPAPREQAYSLFCRCTRTLQSQSIPFSLWLALEDCTVNRTKCSLGAEKCPSLSPPGGNLKLIAVVYTDLSPPYRPSWCSAGQQCLGTVRYPPPRLPRLTRPPRRTLHCQPRGNFGMKCKSPPVRYNRILRGQFESPAL